MRVDANVSVHAIGEPVVPYRIEIKNLNSLYAVRHAIAYEAKRHIRLFEANPNLRALELETRAFDAGSLRTVAMRDKQDALDYRFMPEPNLPPLSLVSSGPSGTWNLLEAVGEPDRLSLPYAVRDRLIKEDGVSALSATVLLDEPGLLDYYKETVAILGSQFRESVNQSIVELVPVHAGQSGWQVARDVKADTAFWITSLFLALLRQNGISSVRDAPLKPSSFADFVAYAAQRYARVRYVHAKRLLEAMFETKKSLSQCIAELAVPAQVNDENQILECVRRTIEAHPESVTSFKKRANKGKFQRAVVLDFLKKTAQRERNDSLNDNILDRLVLSELAARGCQVRFDDDTISESTRGKEQSQPKKH